MTEVELEKPLVPTPVSFEFNELLEVDLEGPTELALELEVVLLVDVVLEPDLLI